MEGRCCCVREALEGAEVPTGVGVVCGVRHEA